MALGIVLWLGRDVAPRATCDVGEVRPPFKELGCSEGLIWIQKDLDARAVKHCYKRPATVDSFTAMERGSHGSG